MNAPLDPLKAKQLEELNQLWNQVRSLLLSWGYKGDHIAYSREKILEGEYLDVALIWLRNYIKEQIGNYQKALKLVPQTVWDAHRAFKTPRKGVYELERLHETKEQIIAVWKTRPSILRRDRIKDKKTNKEATGKGYTIP